MSTDSESETPELIGAVRATNLGRLRELIAQGVDPDARSRGGRTALHAAAEEGILEAARLLLDAGAEVDARNWAGDTPLHCTARYGRGGDVLDPDEDIRPLSRRRTVDPRIADVLVEELKRNKPDLAAHIPPASPADEFLRKVRVLGLAMSWWADPEFRETLYRTLVSRGIDVERVDPAFARDLLGKPDCLDIAELLIDHGADVNALDARGRSVLHEAAGLGDLAMVERLVAHGADPNITGDGQTTPLETAVEFRRLDVAKVLRRAGAKIDGPEMRALHIAAGLGSLTVDGVRTADYVRWLLDQGAPVEGPEGYTAPLILAAGTGDAESAWLLLQRGANVEARTIGAGETALHMAARALSLEVVQLLIAAGARIDARDSSGGAVLHTLAGQDYNGLECPELLEILRLLIAHGADRAARDEQGRTALDFALAAALPADVIALLRMAE